MYGGLPGELSGGGRTNPRRYRIRQDIAVALGIKTALAVPIRVNNRLFGAVMLLNRLDGQELTDRDSLLVEEYFCSWPDS